MFYYKKILGCISQLKKISDDTSQDILRNLQAGSALLLTRENQAQGLLLLSKCVAEKVLLSEDEYVIERNLGLLKQIIGRSISLCKMACKLDPGSCYLYNKVFDSLVGFKAQGIDAFEIQHVKMNISIIRQSIADLKEKGLVTGDSEKNQSNEEDDQEETKKAKKLLDMANHMEENFARSLQYALTIPGLEELDSS